MGHANTLKLCRPLTSGIDWLVEAPEPVELNADPVWVTALGLEHGAELINIVPEVVDTLHLGGPNHLGECFVRHERCPAVAVARDPLAAHPTTPSDPDRWVG